MCLVVSRAHTPGENLSFVLVLSKDSTLDPMIATKSRIGAWIADPESNLLIGDERSMRLEPRAMDVLMHLAVLAKQLGSLHSGALADLMSPLDAGRVDILRSFLNAKPDLSPVVHQLCFLRASAGDPPRIA